MIFKEQDITELICLYKEEFGEVITPAEAQAIFGNALNVLELLSQHPSAMPSRVESFCAGIAP